MALPAEDPKKVSNIVSGQLANFRRLYAPLIENLPNVSFNDSRCSERDWFQDDTLNAKLAQDMDPVRRGNMVRRLPKAFREKLYFEYQAKFRIPRGEFDSMLEEAQDEDATQIKRRQGGAFEQRIARDTEGIKKEVSDVIRKTVKWPSTSQSIKSIFTAGISRSWRYGNEKREKHRASVAAKAAESQAKAAKKDL